MRAEDEWMSAFNTNTPMVDSLKSLTLIGTSVYRSSRLPIYLLSAERQPLGNKL